MSTIYKEIPSFEDRALGASLVITGKVDEIVAVKVDDTIENPQVQTVFRVKVEKTLKGQTDEDSILVRVVGGSSGKIKTDLTIPVERGMKMLMMLSPDYGPDYSGSQFVPYFCSCFPLNTRDEAVFDEKTAEELLGKKIKIEKNLVKVSSLRAFFQGIARQVEEEKAMFEKMEPMEQLTESYGEIMEQPIDETNTAHSARLDDLREGDPGLKI